LTAFKACNLSKVNSACGRCSVVPLMNPELLSLFNSPTAAGSAAAPSGPRQRRRLWRHPCHQLRTAPSTGLGRRTATRSPAPGCRRSRQMRPSTGRRAAAASGARRKCSVVEGPSRKTPCSRSPCLRCTPRACVSSAPAGFPSPRGKPSGQQFGQAAQRARRDFGEHQTIGRPGPRRGSAPAVRQAGSHQGPQGDAITAFC